MFQLKNEDLHGQFFINGCIDCEISTQAANHFSVISQGTLGTLRTGLNDATFSGVLHRMKENGGVFLGHDMGKMGWQWHHVKGIYLSVGLRRNTFSAQVILDAPFTVQGIQALAINQSNIAVVRT